MSTNQKYSQRIHSKRQLHLVREKLDSASFLMADVGSRYSDAMPEVSDACARIVEIINMVEVMVEDIRTHI